MKKKSIIELVIIGIIAFNSLSCSLFSRPANPLLHKIKVGEEKNIADVYKTDCKDIVLIDGKNKTDKIKMFCNQFELKDHCENIDVLVLFIDISGKATGYSIHTYYDDLSREPFYDDIDFKVPFEKVFSKDELFVKRLSKNSFEIDYRGM